MFRRDFLLLLDQVLNALKRVHIFLDVQVNLLLELLLNALLDLTQELLVIKHLQARRENLGLLILEK